MYKKEQGCSNQDFGGPSRSLEAVSADFDTDQTTS